jgi:ATP-binding cassette subfamily F protein 3
VSRILRRDGSEKIQHRESAGSIGAELFAPRLKMETDIRTILPNIDPVISTYSVGYLTHASTSWADEDEASTSSPLNDAAKFVTELLLSASGNPNPALQEKIKSLVDKWVDKYSEANSGEQRGPSAIRRLDKTIQVGSQRNMSSTLAVATGSVDLESANARKVESKVDKKKLEKAEKKIAAKQQKEGVQDGRVRGIQAYHPSRSCSVI